MNSSHPCKPLLFILPINTIMYFVLYTYANICNLWFFDWVINYINLPHNAVHSTLSIGDFAILLSSGMKWYVALMYNSLSAITAIIGMFIGVAIGNASEDSTAWILAITAGVFLYVALVDLVCSRYSNKTYTCVYYKEWL